MSFFGLATFKELQEVEEDAFDRYNKNSKKINELLTEIKRNRESIRYLKDELSKIKRGKLSGQTTFLKQKSKGRLK